MTTPVAGGIVRGYGLGLKVSGAVLSVDTVAILGQYPIDTTGATMGQGLLFNGTEYVPGAPGSAPTGAAGGDLASTYPNPTVKGITLGSDAQGDVYYRNVSGLTRLAAGTSGFFLQTEGAAANPTWSKTATAGLIVSTGQNVSGAVELTLNAASGHQVALQINNAEQARVIANAMLLGTTLDPAEGIPILGIANPGGVSFRNGGGYGLGVGALAATTLGIGDTNWTEVDYNTSVSGVHVFKQNNTERWRAGAGVMVGTTVDGGVGSVTAPTASAFPGAGYNFVKGGVVYGGLAMSTLGNYVLGDLGGGSGGTEFDIWINGAPCAVVHAADFTIQSATGKLVIGTQSTVERTASDLLIGGGNTTGSTILNGHASTTTGVLFQLNGTPYAALHITAASFDSGPILDLGSNVGGVGVAENCPASQQKGTFSVLSSTTLYPCDPTPGVVTGSLPALSTVPRGYRFWIWDDTGQAGAHKISLSPNGTDKIRGANATFDVATVAFAGALVVATGQGWAVLKST